jgi:hypothetical protein
MLYQIFLNTPRWVWVLLLALLWLGLSQTLTRRVTLRRITLTPLAMTALSLFGVVGVFGAGAALLVWLLVAALSATWLARRALPAATRWDPATRRISLPGSWAPLALILGIFLTKYFVGVVTAMQPALVGDAVFALGFSALYGAFSGVFLARAVRLWRLATRPDKAAVQPLAMSA